MDAKIERQIRAQVNPKHSILGRFFGSPAKEQYEALEALHLRDAEILDFSFLDQLPALKSLTLERCSLPEYIAFDGAGYSSVTELELIGGSVGGLDNLDFLLAFPSVRIMAVSEYQNIRNSGGLCNLRGLQELYIHNVLEIDSDGLSRLHWLKMLEMDNYIDGKLSTQKVSYMNSVTRDLSFLADLTELESLTLDGQGLGDVTVLGGLTELRQVELEYNHMLTGLEALTALHRLELLDLSDNGFTAEQKERLELMFGHLKTLEF